MATATKQKPAEAKAEPLTESEARLLVGKQVRIEGNYAGGDYCYEGKVIRVYVPDEAKPRPALEMDGGGNGPGTTINDKDRFPIFVPVRSVLHVRELEG